MVVGYLYIFYFKDETHQYFLSVSKDGKRRKISVEKIPESGVEILASELVPEGNDPIGLKVRSEGTHYNAHYLSTANSYGFTGTNIGMYATKRPFGKAVVQ